MVKDYIRNFTRSLSRESESSPLPPPLMLSIRLNVLIKDYQII